MPTKLTIIRKTHKNAGKNIRRKVSFIDYVLAAPKIAALERLWDVAVLSTGEAKHGLGYLVL